MHLTDCRYVSGSARLREGKAAMDATQRFDVRQNTWYTDLVEFIAHRGVEGVIVIPNHPQIREFAEHLIKQYDMAQKVTLQLVENPMPLSAQGGISSASVQTVLRQITEEGKYHR